jgi:hypothetical protein
MLVVLRVKENSLRFLGGNLFLPNPAYRQTGSTPHPKEKDVCAAILLAKLLT